MESIKLVKRVAIRGRLVVVTGLHIGAGKDAIEIGGIDTPVMKHPHTGYPYVPGSSIKGKLRSLLEWHRGQIGAKGGVWDGGSKPDAGDPILRIFGTTHKDWAGGPTRILVRDASLNSAWAKHAVQAGLALTEEKFENNIDRIQGKAGVGIRKTERVPAGAIFDFEFVYRCFDIGGDGGVPDDKNLAFVFDAMRLLELDALGGSGSRGYGRVRFTDLSVDGVAHATLEGLPSASGLPAAVRAA